MIYVTGIWSRGVLIERFKCDLCVLFMEQRCPDREV